MLLRHQLEQTTGYPGVLEQVIQVALYRGSSGHPNDVLIIQRMHTGAAINQNMKLLRRNNPQLTGLLDIATSE